MTLEELHQLEEDWFEDKLQRLFEKTGGLISPESWEVAVEWARLLARCGA
jgi:hypothetical protein